MQVDRSRQSPNHSSRNGVPVELLLLHATVGSFESAVAWLCNPQRQRPAARVSSHYVLRKDGYIAQLVDESRSAWHAGKSTWDGVTVVDGSVNDCSISIELENDNTGRDPYPFAQRDALVWLIQDIQTRYPIPLQNIVRHFDVCLPKGRKSDPANFPMPWLLEALGAPYTAHSPIMGQPKGTLAQTAPKVISSYYTPFDVGVILGAYWQQSLAVGLDPVLAIAQMCHETGWGEPVKPLSSFWSQRPQRNPAGIGVSGASRSEQPSTPNWCYNTQRYRWEIGLSFRDWVKESIPAHLGRLLAYALPVPRLGAPTTHISEAQSALIKQALAVRPLPTALRGSASTLKGLGGTWATDVGYGERIARWANRLVGA